MLGFSSVSFSRVSEPTVMDGDLNQADLNQMIFTLPCLIVILLVKVNIWISCLNLVP